MADKDNPLVLIVDDNPRNLQVLGKLLTNNGYELGGVQSGEKALEFVRKRLPDLILLDIMMPGMDGYEVCASLKADAGTKHIPIIFLTAKVDPDDIAKGFEVGGVDYVTKPFNAVELLARVKTHVEMKILKGLLPVCSNCKKIRDKEGIWTQIEDYIESHSEALFSHGLCVECMDNLYSDQEWYKKRRKTPK